MTEAGRRLFIHIGMHKTGSTAIQASFAKLNRPNVAYLALNNSNHSAIHATMFMTNPVQYMGHRRNNRTVEEVEALRAEFRARVEASIASTSANMVSSAEDLVVMDIDGLVEMRRFYSAHFDDLQIIGYVRPPSSYMASALQQRIVGGVNAQFHTLYPMYRHRFEKFDTVFGRENVTLVKFDRATLLEGDVVADFGSRIGGRLAPEEVVNANQSRSLEATALLFAARQYGAAVKGQPGGQKRYHRNLHRVSDLLSDIGKGRIQLHADIVGPMLATHRADLDWIEARLGTSLAEELSDSPDALRSVEDLLPIAAKAIPELGRVIVSSLSDAPKDPRIAAHCIDFLMGLTTEAQMIVRKAPAPKEIQEQRRARRAKGKP